MNENYFRWRQRCLIVLFILMLAELIVVTSTVFSQEEVASAIRRYKGYESSTGYYEEFEVKPNRIRPFVGVSEVKKSVFSYSPAASEVRVRTRLSDSHYGIRFYENLSCQYCHPAEAMDIHTTRANLSCRQCHGAEPIASIEHYYSSLNPIRKHAYVCSKCHEGASASFASYIVHEPAPGSPEARKTFSELYYAYWFMMFLLTVTLAFFIPHSFLVGLRELIKQIGKWRNQ